MTEYQENLPLMPITQGVVFPGMLVPLALETDEARAAVEAAGSAGGRLVLVPHIDRRYSSVGVVAEIVQAGEADGGTSVVVVRGERRVSIGAAAPTTGDALWVSIEAVAPDYRNEAVDELAREYRAVLESTLVSRGARQLAEQLRQVSDPGQTADLAGYSRDLSLEQKVQVLATLDVEERLEKTQREFLLRRQLEAIRKELNTLSGEAEDGEREDYRAQLASRNLPEKVRAAISRELDKLERTNEQSPEQGWIRTWLDTVFELPWGEESPDRLDIAEASAILALVGPPGVGKTSLGESIARALGRSFARVALGGVHDEAEIRGHRRTYVGAQPGRIVRAFREA